MESQKALSNLQILANIAQTAMAQVPWDKQEITYDVSKNPITLKYYMTKRQVGEVHITYNADNNPTVVEKVSF